MHKTNVYEELPEEQLLKLSVQHCTRGQKIPTELMNLLEELNIATHIKDMVSETPDNPSY